MSFDSRKPVCAAVMWAGLAPVAMGACKITIMGELSVDTAHNRILTAGTIDAHPVTVLIDTGSAFSFIWESAARRLNLPIGAMPGVRIYGIGGWANASQTALKRLQIGTFYANDLRLVVLGGGAGQSADAPVFVLGDDLLSHFDTEFDLAHGKVRLLRTAGCKLDETPYWTTTFSEADLEGSDITRPQIRANVLVNGKSVSALFDTGSLTSTITRAAAERAGVTPWRPHTQAPDRISGIGSEQEESWVGTFSVFAVGDETVRNVSLRIADLFRADREVKIGSHVAREVEGLPTMLIGCDFFLRHRMLVLSKQRKLVFTYNGGPIFQVMEGESAHSP